MNKKTATFPINLKKQLHALSHDLKQPLSLIRVYAYYLKKKFGQEPDVSEYATKIETQVDQLSYQLDRIVALNRYQQDLLPLKLSDVPVTPLLENIRDQFQLTHPKAKIVIKSDSSLSAKLDEDKIKSALRELITNGIDYSPEQANINITASIKNNVLIIAVTDTGHGFVSDEIPQVFSAYSKGTAAQQTAENNKHIGLGLSLALAIVKLHKGTITIQPNKPKGSIVTIELPVN